MIYVGDETRDITAAQKSQVQVVAVAWGFNSPQILSQFNPDHLIDHSFRRVYIEPDAVESLVKSVLLRHCLAAVVI